MDSPIVLLPVIVILAVAIITRRTLFAMLCGLAVASVILANGIENFVPTFFDNLYKGMSNETLQWLLLVIALFGVLIQLFERSNAIQEFGTWTSRFIRSKRQALVGTFILGIVVFIDDYLNNLAVGTTMKSITDKHKIPRAHLGYVVNSTAAPVCVLLPISSWAVYFSGLFEAEGIVVNGTGAGAYIQSIPFIFYGWFAIIVVLLQILGVIPKIGPIRKDYKRAEESGDLFPEGTERALSVQGENGDGESEKTHIKPHWWNFLAPLAIMIIVTLLTDTDVLLGVGAGVVSAFLLYLVERKLSFKELLSTSFDGILSMGFVLILSVLAFSVQSANLDLELADYVIGVVKPLMNGGFLPAVVFLVCAVYAYTTGCFWDMAVIVTPIVLPLALAMGVNPILAGAAVFSGAAFGSNTCLYGDGVILASQATGIRAVDLMLATLPYALVAGGASFVCYLIAGFVF